MRFEDTIATFDALARSTGIDTDALLPRLREVTGGTVSDVDLMRIGSKLFGAGMASTAEEIVALVTVPHELVARRIVPPNWE